MDLILGNIHFDYDKSLLTESDMSYNFGPRQKVMRPKWIKIWESAFNPGDLVLDLGAYIGIISVHLALLGGIVHAFEGSLRNVRRLKFATQFLRQITIHPVALNKVNKKCRTRFNDCIGREHPEQDITYVIYDEYAKCKGLQNPKFVKMDIEGMETVALFGMQDLLYKVRPIWQIEYHFGLPFHYSEYPGFLSPQQGGFDFEEFNRHHYVIVDDNMNIMSIADMHHDNYFMIPEEKFNGVKRFVEKPTSKVLL